MSIEKLKQAANINPKFRQALSLRVQASKLNALQAGKKLELADQAVDCLFDVLADLIIESGVQHGEKQ